MVSTSIGGKEAEVRHLQRFLFRFAVCILSSTGMIKREVSDLFHVDYAASRNGGGGGGNFHTLNTDCM
jgi:hypothetical protein